MNRETPLHLTVCGRHGIEGSLPDEPHIVISIRSKGETNVYLPHSPNTRAVLRLMFDDTFEANDAYRTPFTAEMASAVLNFVDGWYQQRVNNVLVHCMLGVSRSPAVAVVLHEIYNGDSKMYFAHYHPNPLVVEVMRNEQRKSNG